jgi:hypothetical protein
LEKEGKNMSKRHQQRPSKEHVGRNEPGKSVPISAGAGTVKKQATYHMQAMQGIDPGKQPPLSKVPPMRTMHSGLTHKANSRRRTSEETYGGSDARAQAQHAEERVRRAARQEEFARDLEVSQRPAAEMGLGEASPPGSGFTAASIKAMHTILADLTNDELRSITIIPTGTRLEEGAQYIDLNHLENGAFVADARMIAGPEHYYVAKKDTGYVLWNRLNQVENPARLDEAGPPAP